MAVSRRLMCVLNYSTFGGPFNRVMRLARPLADVGISTVAVVAEGPGNGAARLRQAGLDVLQLPLYRLRRSGRAEFIRNVGGDVSRIRQVIRSQRPDWVQVNGVQHLHVAIAAHREGVPVVWMIVDENVPRWLRTLLMPTVRRYAGAVMTSGEAVRRSHRIGGELLARTVVYYPPVDTDQFRPDAELRARARARLGLPADSIVVGTVGNLFPAKDHLTFVRAAALLRRRIPGVRVVLAGSAYPEFARYSGRVFTEARALGLDQGGTLLYRDGAPSAEVMPALDVFWLTSATEGAPTALQEAMSGGLPVLATRVGSVAEIVDDRVDGYLLPPGDAEGFASRTAALLSDSALRAALASRARERALLQFSLAACVRAHQSALAIAMGRTSADGRSAV